MHDVALDVSFRPPWWPEASDDDARRLQLKCRQHLREAAIRAIEGKKGFPSAHGFEITIAFTRRGTDGPDAASIIGGIADVLEGVIVKEGRQLRAVYYNESPGNRNEYSLRLIRRRDRHESAS